MARRCQLGPPPAPEASDACGATPLMRAPFLTYLAAPVTLAT